MNRTIEYYEIRIHKMQAKDPVGNANLINKLNRKIKAIKDKEYYKKHSFFMLKIIDINLLNML